MNVDIITKEDLKYLNQKIESLESMMKSFLSIGQSQGKPEENFYTTRKELSKKLRLSLTTIDKLTREGKLKGYQIGGRIRYKSNEVNRALEAIKDAKYKR